MVDTSVVDNGISKEGKMKGNIVKVDEHRHRFDELQLQVDKVNFLSGTQTNFLSVKILYTYNLSRIICNI